MNDTTLIQSAIREYESRHYQTSYPLFRKLSKKNDKDALYYLGLHLFYGRGVPKNEAEAFKLFTKAAIELHAGAIMMLGLCHEEGQGVVKNLKQAYEYYVAASHQGNQDASLKLAEFYEKGIIVEQSFAKALEFYVDLAKRDNAYAMYQIGKAYFLGEGLKKNLESAYSWFNKALSKGSVDAMNYFRLIGTKSARDIRETKSLYSIAKDYYASDEPKNAIIYFEIAAREGISEAYRDLSEAYKVGRGVEMSPLKSFEYMLKGAESKDIPAMIALAKKYEAGDGVESSFIRAEKWYLEAAKNDSLEAKNELLSLRGYPYE
ncbi:MAG: hypothetical protein PHI01_01630 [Candidatus Izemoplasmatales bacterium]|jgi:hypothetical protein|nr:hypothetical protein [Candidatus Izemoplasmatales bacterium]